MLFLATLACQLNLGGPARPGAPIQISDSSATSLRNLWETTFVEAGLDGQVILAINEVQLSSLVAQRLARQDDPLLINPNVYLREGQILIYGDIDQGLFRSSVLLTIRPEIQNDGRLSLEVESAEIGPIPVPDSLRQSTSGVLTEAFTGSFGSFATGFRVLSVSIDDGLMILLGDLR